MKKSGWLIAGIFYLILLEISKVYFIMPFPGSQRANTINIAYFIHTNIWWLRIIGILLAVNAFTGFINSAKKWQKALLVLGIILYGFIYYLFNFRFLADKMFYQPKEKIFLSAAKDTSDRNKLVLGVVIGQEAKAYPIEIIGYHHQVFDTIGGEPVIVTYCTVCRTGRVYSPAINGKPAHFRLVGMDHFNAMFEDADTHSWWQQATGIAIAGSLKGTQLTELPAAQLSLANWLAAYPQSSILQKDSHFKKEYNDLKGFDEGTIKGKLEHRDSLSWQFKSWVVGVQINGQARAYDWNELRQSTMLSDTLANIPLLINVSTDGKTFHVFNRTVNKKVLQFISTAANEWQDAQTRSVWQLNGQCIAGKLQGAKLEELQAYQEFWHSWQYFHPATTKYLLHPSTEQAK
jgi:hypothetical protein